MTDFPDRFGMRPIPTGRPTGRQMFDALTPAQQDAQYGPEIAQLLRDGTIELEDLVATRKMATADDFISAASVKEALANAARRKATN